MRHIIVWRLSNHLTAEAAIKNSGQLLLSAPERFPLSLRHPRCRRTLPPGFLLVTLFFIFSSCFSGPDFITILSIFSPHLWPGLSKSKFPSPEPFLLTPLYLATAFPFPPSLLPSFLFPQCQAESDLTLINKFHLPRWSRNIVQMQKLISSLQ